MDPVGRVGMILHLYFPSVRMEKETERGRNRYMMDRFLVRADSHVPVVDYHLARLLPSALPLVRLYNRDRGI